MDGMRRLSLGEETRREQKYRYMAWTQVLKAEMVSDKTMLASDMRNKRVFPGEPHLTERELRDLQDDRVH